MPWWQTAVIYQIYPRSFQDSNADGLGDLAGISQRLPYFAELGVDAIWLSPIFPSPMADFGYDIADYEDIDPVFGTLAEFDVLLDGSSKAAQRATTANVIGTFGAIQPRAAVRRTIGSRSSAAAPGSWIAAPANITATHSWRPSRISIGATAMCARRCTM